MVWPMATLAEEDSSHESECRGRSYRSVARSLNQCLGSFTHCGGIVANFRAKIAGQQPDQTQTHQHIRGALEEGRHIHGRPSGSGRWLSPADRPNFDDLGRPGRHRGRCGSVLIGGSMRIAQIEIVSKVMMRTNV